MKKRLLCLALALTLLLALAVPVWGYSGFQDFLNATGRLKGVDYTRIRQDTRQYIRVTFEIGSQSFNGMLKKGYRLEDKEADGIIKSTMLGFGLNETKLALYEMDIARAKSLDPAFKPQFWIEMIGQLMGAGDAFAAKAIAEGKMTGTQFFMDKFTDKVISQGAAAFAEYAAMGPAGAFIVNALTGSVKPMAKEVLKAIQNEEVKQKAIVAAALLDAFYQRCNQRLKEEADKKDNTSWRLTASGKSKVERTLFGAPVMQNWTLKCDLRIEEDTEKPGGIYSGVMAVDITHDMTKFDGKFLSLVANELGALPEAIQKARAVGNNIYDCWSTPSKLEKHLLAKRVRFVIPDNVAGYAKDAFIDEVGIRDFFQSKEDFWSLHPLWVVPNGVLPIMDQQGRYSFPGGGAGQFVAIWNLMGEIWDGFSPQIYLMSSDYIGRAHGKTWSIDNSQTTSGGVLKVNHDIFSDLESGGITLRMGWKGEEA